ncbi:MAG: hypothetical protein GY775_11415 [Candidatus Scalindua sp.]|nr:hypothetical protein [Candidatus Scalindua sp.]
MSTDDSDYIKCKICKEDIRRNAVICSHCNSFQNWRRHLGLSSSFLSIMIAFISVLTVFITVASNSLTKKDSDINASVVSWQRAFFNKQGEMAQVLVADIFVTNNGKKPGAIKAISVKGINEDEFRYFRSEMQKTNDRYSNHGIDPKIVEPGNTLLLKRYLVTNLDISTFENVYSNSVLLLEVINFSGEDQNITLKVENTLPILFN